jgi:ribosomal protein L37AE/L43A
MIDGSVNLYRILKVRADATQDQIKAAYRSRIRKAHTDAGGTQQEAAAVNSAYETLQHHHAAYREARAVWAAKRQAVICPSCGEANRITGLGVPICGECKVALNHPDQFRQFKLAAVAMANEVGAALLQKLSSELKRRIG